MLAVQVALIVVAAQRMLVPVAAAVAQVALVLE
jgi:hypothetical protein